MIFPKKIHDTHWDFIERKTVGAHTPTVFFFDSNRGEKDLHKLLELVGHANGKAFISTGCKSPKS